MDYNRVLIALIDHVEASAKNVSLDWDEVQQWNEGVLGGLVAVGMLTKGVNTSSLQCLGCEYHCLMDVLLVNDDGERAFIVCDQPEMQSQMGRINVLPERLQQWQTSVKHLAIVIAGLLDFETKPDYQKDATSYPIGMRRGGSGRRWVNLLVNPLSLEINCHTVPLNDLLYFEGGVLLIDEARIDALVNTEPKQIGKVYKPNDNKQAARKLVTQAMYQDWNDEYLKLKKKNPDKSDTWCSRQIARMSIAQGKDSETIRKNMKK